MTDKYIGGIDMSLSYEELEELDKGELIGMLWSTEGLVVILMNEIRLLKDDKYLSDNKDKVRV